MALLVSNCNVGSQTQCSLDRRLVNGVGKAQQTKWHRTEDDEPDSANRCAGVRVDVVEELGEW